MSALKVVALDRDTLCKRPFAFDFEHELIEYPRTAPQETAERLAGADVVITNKVLIDSSHLAANPQLKLIAVAATGYNNVDIEAARRNGTAVCNIPAYSSDSVAEHAMMMILALMRNLPAYQRDVAAGLWAQSPFFCHFGAPMRDVKGKTLVIFGKGSIGKTLAAYAEVFGMRVVFGEHKHASQVREGYVAFDEALREADVVSLNSVLNEGTRNMIGEEELRQMKPGAILINVGRGGLADERAVVAALKYGTLGGAGFDVLTEEPPVNGNPLTDTHLPNLIVTPHMAWASQEAQNRLFDKLTDNINAFAAGRPQNVVV